MSESPALSWAKKFCAAWAESFSGLLASHGVVSPKVETSEPVSATAPTAEEFEKMACVRFSGGGSLKGELLWVAEKPAALHLAQLMMSETPDPAAEFTEIQRDAFSKLLRQVAIQTATAWKAESGTDTEIIFQPTVEPAPVTAQLVTFRLAGEKFADLSLRLFLNDDLAAALDALAAPVEPAKPSPESTPAAPQAHRSTPLPTNLGLVLDVELEATIRFGERQMLLRDVFGLMPGAVVELDQMVNEPAELLVAGRLVARGEVVVVDGNFGLRVTEVASVNERAAAIPL